MGNSKCNPWRAADTDDARSSTKVSMVERKSTLRKSWEAAMPQSHMSEDTDQMVEEIQKLEFPKIDLKKQLSRISERSHETMFTHNADN